MIKRSWAKDIADKQIKIIWFLKKKVYLFCRGDLKIVKSQFKVPELRS